jgi:hypothetical protein
MISHWQGSKRRVCVGPTGVSDLTHRLSIPLLILGGLIGCDGGTRSWVEPPVPDAPARELRVADTGFTPTRASTATVAVRPPESRIDVSLRVLNVQIPRAQRTQAATIWDQLREDIADSATRQRLYRNGIRVGLGRTERWDAIQQAVDAIDGHRSYQLPPLRALPGVPLLLELDREPKDQTIFYVEHDGILSGDTWPASQRMLRITYGFHPFDLKQVLLNIVPEIHRRIDSQLSYTDGGWTAGPERQGRAYGAAGFGVPLGPDEFVLLAPGEKADVIGLVGGAFLTDKSEDQAYDSYVFLRVDVNHVDQRR